MPVFEIELSHKKQTKANDCWYACIQMLKTWDAGGVKTKPSGEHTAHLHSGLMGHRLNADSSVSKHFSFVLHENGLKTIGKDELRLMNPKTAMDCLQKYGPIILGGTFGDLGPFKNLGHFIVLSGVDTDTKSYKINDPDKRDGAWVSIGPICSKSWGDDESAIVLDRG